MPSGLQAGYFCSTVLVSGPDFSTFEKVTSLIFAIYFSPTFKNCSLHEFKTNKFWHKIISPVFSWYTWHICIFFWPKYFMSISIWHAVVIKNIEYQIQIQICCNIVKRCFYNLWVQVLLPKNKIFHRTRWFILISLTSISWFHLVLHPA